MSDTHSLHELIHVPDGDVLIHAGDILNRGKLKELEQFCEWFVGFPHKHKIVIAGNHDAVLQLQPNLCSNYFQKLGVNYLCDSAIVIEEIKFYGSPWVPAFQNWFFMKERGKDIAAKWSLIPDDVDVLVTHGPPAGILDVANRAPRGCADLYARIKEVKPQYNIFGHIHENYNQIKSYSPYTGIEGIEPDMQGVTFVNCSVLNESYEPVGKPIIFDISVK